MYKVLPCTLSDYYVHCSSQKSEVQRGNKLHANKQRNWDFNPDLSDATIFQSEETNIIYVCIYIYINHEPIFWSPASIFNQWESTLALWSGCQRLMNCIERWRKAKAKHTEPDEKCTCPTQTSGCAKTGSVVGWEKTLEINLLEGRSWSKRRKGLSQTGQWSREIPHDEEWLMKF